MTLNNAYNQYKENSVRTATPEEHTLMLYNGLVKYLMQAQMAVNDNKIEKAGTCIIKAQDIISEFRSTLDMQYDISHQLEQLYDYMYRRLVDANIKKDIGIIEEILGFAKELRDTWEKAIKIARQQQSTTKAQVAR